MANLPDNNNLQEKIKSNNLTSTEKKELEINKQIKPKLRKFLIQEQKQKAEQTVKEEIKEREEMLSSNEIINRAAKLANKALIDLKLWQKYPPYLDMTWTKAGLINDEMKKDQQIDITGFGYYLVREYRNYLKLKRMTKGYPNPMDEKNLEFFWIKCWADMRLLIEADRRRKAAGNAGIIILDKPSIN